MRRSLGRLAASLGLALVPALLGGGAALLYSEAGTRLLGRLAGLELGRVFRGRFAIERVAGSFVRGVELHRVEIRDTSGGLLALVPRLRVAYQPAQLAAGRFVFDRAELEDPVIRLVKRKDGRLNLHEIFRLGEGPPSGRPGPLIEFRDLRFHRGSVEVWLPWNPPDTATTPAQVAAALAADRARPGRVVLETPDGLRRVVTLSALDARVSRLTVSHPDGSPLTFEVDSLATRVSDPAVTVVDLGARGWTRGDSLAFTLHRAALPNSRFTGGGVVTWPRGPVLYDFTLEAPRLDLADLRWVSPDFPAMTGRALITARSRSEQVTAYTLRDLDLRAGPARIAGVVTVVTDTRRGLGVEGMTLELTQVNLDVARPYLDTLPLHGRLTGRLEGAGYLDGLDVTAAWQFDDDLVPGGAVNYLGASGHLVFGGPEGTLLDTVVVQHADLDLRSVRVQAPAVTLHGRVELAGTLAGPWRNLTFRGTAVHRDGGAESRAAGTARLDTRDPASTGFEVDARLDPLALDGLRASYPGLPSRGALTGRVRLEGTARRFRLASEVRGELGTVVLDGVVTTGPEGFGAESLTVRYADLDLAALTGRDRPRSALNGWLEVSGTYDTVAGPTGRLALAWSRSRLGGFTLDTLAAAIAARDSILQVDTALAAWRGGRLEGRGALGWRRPGDRSVTLAFRADSLIAFDTLLAHYLGEPLDSTHQPLEGSATGEIVLAGATNRPRVILRGRGPEIRWRGTRWLGVGAGAAWNAAARPELNAVVAADSLMLGSWTLDGIGAVLGGYADSLAWSLAALVGDSAPIHAGGEWWSTGPRPLLQVDSLRLSLPSRAWVLRAPAQVRVEEGWFDLTPVVLESGDGSGAIRVEGQLARGRPATLRLSAFGIPVRDVYQLLERDTAGVGGTVQLDLTVGGTAAAPTLRGVGSLDDLSFGDFGAPYVQGVLDYADRRLETNLLLWRTGQPVLRVEARLPLDLALTRVSRRQLDGPILVRATADSTDLGVAEAFTRNLRRVRGVLDASVTVTGTWNTPRLGGEIRIQNASAAVPGLGVRYTGLTARAHLAGDSIAVDTFVVRSGEGSLTAAGNVRLERLTRPVLDLTFRARRFRVLDVRNFLTLDASGTARLTGPFWRARLTGRVTADQGNLHFADLVTKRIVDLENPGDSGLIDLTAIREQRLGADFESRFLDSLTIDDLQLTMGEGVWLRSNEANIQLEGNLTINKVRDRYRYDGTLNAIRGNYNLRVGPVTRDFTVERGTVQYFGTPDLNAALDIQARHVVISTDATNKGEEIPVIAKITGTLLQPKLTLESTQRPPLSETELVSYLVYGRPSFSLQGGGRQGDNPALSAALSYLSSALSSEIQRTLISDLGVPIDYIDIRPGEVSAVGAAGPGASAQLAQVAAGWQIGRKWFVTLVADLCTNTQRFYPNAEYRVSRQFRLKGSVEPAYSCQALAGQPSFSSQKYQVGLDFLWEREY
ncbi:MAG TPA: translocation/assembly module TamB domain-containing protein [Gemmatimonadales bacterium]|jgi:translocation and assembly module TamB|nr:translocation/assembly module TamB domain-containing protein [Gemmatimonadales bacterium]